MVTREIKKKPFGIWQLYHKTQLEANVKELIIS